MTFTGSEKAASEVIGHIIILGLTVTGISLITLVGVPTIYSLQDMANVRNAEQVFTVMDSRVSAVVLGNAPVQFLNINLGGGTITVEPNGTGTESYIKVNIANGSGYEDITMPMGKIRYHLGDRIVAYEGGGVWSKYPSGGSVMLSPPEFHYNGVTLTLPVINVSGGGSIGGSGSATIKFVKGQGPIIMYPDASNTNPVNSSGESRVYVNITSEFYDAWADYAKSLGYTIVSEDETNSSVNIRLTVVPTTLGLETSITDPITFSGLDSSDDTPLESWNFRIRLSGNNLNWDLRATTGNKKLIFYLKGSGLIVGDEVDLYVGYQNDGPGYSDPAETWETEGTNEIIVQEDADGLYVDVNLLNTTRNLTYKKEIVGSNSVCTPSKINSGDFNDSGGFSWVGETLNDSFPKTEKSIYNLTQHYIWLVLQEGTPSFNNCGPQTPSGDSTMLVNYTATNALTYLHISDNRADVNII